MFRSEREFHRSMQRYDHTVFVAESARQSLCKLLPYLTDKSSTIYNVVEPDEIRNRSKEEITDCSFNADEFNLISVGQFREVKAFDRLIRITKRLQESGINAHLYLLGKGALRDSYVHEAARLGILDKVTIIGFRENPYKYVAKADLFVCSSLHEGFSTAVTESLIVGTPIVTTSCSGMEELLGSDGEYGIITDNDEQALGDTLLRLIPDTDRMQALRDATKRRAIDFSKQQALNANINLLRSNS
jgi:glycosyltransferase involved in cell wall biosynthesis